MAAVRWSALGVGVALVVLLGTSGCSAEGGGDDGGADPAVGPSSSASTSPADADEEVVPPQGSNAPDDRVQAVVVAVTDGDTLAVRLEDGTVETVRLIGINAPEAGECFADQATEVLAELVAGETVVLLVDESDRDQYGRLLRHVEHEGTSVNVALVRDGVARSRSYPPDTARQVQIDLAEEEARAGLEGLWAPEACGPASSVEGDVAIVAVVADPPGSDEADPNAETATVRNLGRDPVDLSGWVLKDTSSSHRFTFPAGFVLAPSASAVVHTGCGADSPTDLHWCNQGSLVWNNDGDTAYLEDPAGNTVSTFEV